MKMITRILLAVFCLFLAIGCFVFGVPAGGLIFLLLGFVFEGLFWTGLFGRRKAMRLSR